MQMGCNNFLLFPLFPCTFSAGSELQFSFPQQSTDYDASTVSIL